MTDELLRFFAPLIPLLIVDSFQSNLLSSSPDRPESRHLILLFSADRDAKRAEKLALTQKLELITEYDNRFVHDRDQTTFIIFQ